MVPILRRSKARKERERGRILRGVYEENLQLLHKKSFLRTRRRRIIPKRSLAYLFVCLFSFLFYSFEMKIPSLSNASHVIEQASFSSRPSFIPKASINNRGDISEFRTLERRSNVPLSRMLGLGIQTIVIDAGHGGTDLGTVGRTGIMEKDITLDIAKKLKSSLAVMGYKNVLMTRVNDSIVSLHERVDFARKSKADLFLSIHINSLPNTPINIIETFYFGPSSDQRVVGLVGRENQGSEYGLSDFKEILERLGTAMKLQESMKFAESIQENLFENSNRINPGIKDNGVKRAPFAVLIGLDVPSVLAEVSCLSSPSEEMRLISREHRDNIAQYLAKGVANYLTVGAENDVQVQR
jgi:N-acetylmuramoyl-L-alanine amidase